MPPVIQKVILVTVKNLKLAHVTFKKHAIKVVTMKITTMKF
jgi:hypothetical protein